MPDGLYDRDFLLWSEVHADLLRRLAAGERVNDAIDWPNLIEEVEGVGRSELAACKSLLRQALVHLLKLRAWPGSQSVRHWRAEITVFLAGAGDRFSPSMRHVIDLPRLHADALAAVRLSSDDSGEPYPVLDTCPYTLDQLLADDVAALWSGPER